MDALVNWITDDKNFRPMISALVIVMGTVIVYMVMRVVMKNNTVQPAQAKNGGGATKLNASEDEEDDYDELSPNILDTRNDPDVLYGATDLYDWNQSESEVEIFVKLDKVENAPALRAKNIKATITSTTLCVSVNGTVLVKGDFPAKVLADDCTWQLEEPRNGDKRIWITLYKAVQTTRNQHWKSALKGDAEIDVGKLGPPVHGVDTGSKASMKKAIQQMKAYGK